MSAVGSLPGRGPVGQALVFLRASEPRSPVTRRSAIADVAFAALVMAASLTAIVSTGTGVAYTEMAGRLTGQIVLIPQPRAAWVLVVAAAGTAAPLALRRRYPLAALLVLVAAVLATRRYTTDVAFLAIVFAGHSAVAHSRFRGAAMLTGPLVGVAVSVAYWNYGGGGSQVRLVPGFLVAVAGAFRPAAPWRVTALVTMVALISITVVASTMHAAQSQARVGRLQAEHEAATRRAVELERARIASELHDVVTHNVSVMIVQAGAARQVLAASPEQATDALLAVESSGRAAMAELRHLLGLLSPAGPGAADGDGADGSADLRPQPGLSQLPALAARVRVAGLPVELAVGELPHDLAPGLDLAAYRIVQEALTNVLKHAGKPRTSVSVVCRDGRLVVEVADGGPPIPAAALPPPAGGRGLIGLRERAALYGGELQAGPRPEGGWLLRASIPVRPPAVAGPQSSPGLAPVPGPALVPGPAGGLAAAGSPDAPGSTPLPGGSR